jgi:hypothetical protein
MLCILYSTLSFRYGSRTNAYYMEMLRWSLSAWVHIFMTLGFFLMNDHVYMMRYAIIKNLTFSFSNIDTLPTPSYSNLPVLNPYFSILIPYHCHLTHICPTLSKSYSKQAQKQVISVNMPNFQGGSAPSLSLIRI